MKFLIQTIDKKIVHDFSFTLIKSIEFNNWVNNDNDITYRLSDIDGRFYLIYTPIGSIDFVHKYMNINFGQIPKPINVPNELLINEFTRRSIFNGNNLDVKGHKFIKSNDTIKGFTEIINTKNNPNIPIGNYQISEIINIDSEYRCFVYQGKLVGIYYYIGDFTIFPNIKAINSMIKSYKSAPIAYTLDVGINKNGTFVIEVHNFYSCGLYGFSDLKLLAHMFNRWFYEYKCNLYK